MKVEGKVAHTAALQHEEEKQLLWCCTSFSPGRVPACSLQAASWGVLPHWLTGQGYGSNVLHVVWGLAGPAHSLLVEVGWSPAKTQLGLVRTGQRHILHCSSSMGGQVNTQL